MDLALNNLERLICHKIQPTNHLLQRPDAACQEESTHENVLFLQKGTKSYINIEI